MNITLIRSNKRKNSTTYNSAEYLISKLENVDKVYEFTCRRICHIYVADVMRV